MPDHGTGRVHRFRDHVVAGVNWRPTRFVDEVPNSRVCGLCRMIPKQTVLLPCSHALCQSCHAASFEGGVGHCPLDREPFEEAECFGYQFPTRKANTLKVYCWNETHGCEYTGTIDRMLEHYENECTFHSVECLRCGERVQHSDLPKHYAAGCTAGVPCAIAEYRRSEHTALTIEDVSAALEDLKAMLGDPNHDQLHPVIQSQLNELTEQVRNQEATFAEITRELRASEQNLKDEMDQIAAMITSTVPHQPNPEAQASTSVVVVALGKSDDTSKVGTLSPPITRCSGTLAANFPAA
ncbi:E3 ubiquitin-protein ligase PDZRN3 isoform X23 [Dermacentor silvarum]|uniref:E3 ubiquitin-protein ligase PDZRN3 isoform X23 n=1 Tax=Dermacentor silvarum TaxID=543639 RepID=UPI002101B28A|nr:E3 ubiquitin-protein ligase PDZRN3 isoform X23 [Dermacentor silvarum]